MTMLELLGAVGLISVAPVIGVAMLLFVFFVFKPEEKRITDDLTLFSSKGTYWLKRKLPLFACPIIAVVAAVIAIKTFPNSPAEFRIVESILMGVMLFAPFAFFTLKEVGIGGDYLYVPESVTYLCADGFCPPLGVIFDLGGVSPVKSGRLV